MKNKSIVIYLFSILCAIIMAYLVYLMYFKNEINSIISDHNINKKLDLVSKKKKLSDEKKEELLINTLFYSLNKTDKHSMYFDKDKYKEFNTSLNSTLVGIGIMAQQTKDSLIVKRVFDKTPAKLSGLKENDKIIQVDSKILKDIKNKSFTSFIKGNENTSVNLQIIRNGKKIVKYVVRKSIKLDQIYTKNINDKYYLKIDSFGEGLADDFESKIDDINKTSKLIIDLRDNSGGELSQVSKILSFFVKNGDVILQRKVKGKTSYNYANYTSKKINVPVNVIVNNNSASASEILALDLKELVNAKLIGKKTYGKGSVQQLVPLNDNSAFKYTIEKWYSAKGTGIDHKGINVDIDIEDKNNENLGFEQSLNKDKLIKIAMEK